MDGVPSLAALSWTAAGGPPAGQPVMRQVERVLRDAIVGMRLLPGAKMSEQAIARQLGTSRQPVREALIRLAEAGLVQIRPQRGTLVAPLSVQDVLDAHFVRDAIECAVVRDAAAAATKSSASALRDTLAAQRRAARTGDGDGFFAADEAFHRTLAEMSGHMAAWRVVQDVKPRLDRIRVFNMRRAQRRALVMRQHLLVLRHVAAGDADAACAAMRAHLANVPESLPGLVAEHPGLFATASSPGTTPA